MFKSFKDEFVKTRANRECINCKSVIKKGTRVFKQTGIEGKIIRIFWCNSCKPVPNKGGE